MTDRPTGIPNARPGRDHEGVEAMVARVRRVEARRQRRQQHRNGRAAGALLVGVWASAVLSSLFLDRVPDPGAYLVPAAGICTGLVCLAIPWGRISPGWLQVAIAAATIEVAIWVALADLSFGVYYLLIAAFAGYVSLRRGEVAGQAALILAALLVPLSYESDRGAVAGHVLLIMPAVATLLAMAGWVRGHVTSRQRLYRQFAIEALHLAIRIRGDALPPQPLEIRPEDGSGAEDGSTTQAFERLATELETLVGPAAPAGVGRLRRRMVYAAVLGAIAFGLPLATAGLAAAGVTMPKLARAPFDALSIDLPNQRSAAASDDPIPSRSVSGDDRSGGRPPSRPPRHVSTPRQRHTGSQELSAPTGQVPPDSAAASAPSERVSSGSLVAARGAASTSQPRDVPQSQGGLGATLLTLLPDGDVIGDDLVSTGGSDGVDIDRLARAGNRLSRRWK